VQDRTLELSELSTHLQSLAEQEKAALSRELHDELGGLLVAARMDVSWLEERVGSTDPEVRAHFRRVQEVLQSGVDIKRRVTESLRPTLLDNLGLVPALRWQVADHCARAGLKHIEHYPPGDLRLTPEASIVVFRIVQEALTNVLKHARAQIVEVVIDIRPPWLVVRIRDDGVGMPLERLRVLGSHGLAAMRHRTRVLGGQWAISRPPAGGTQIEVRLPLERVLAETVAAPETGLA
jgi:signal transduction histidine kinase